MYDSVTPCTYEYNRSYLENYSKTQQTAHTHLIHSLSPSFYQHKRFSLSFALSLSLSFLLSPFHPLFIYSHSSLFFLLPLLLLLLSLSTSLSLHRRVFINTNVSIKMSRPVESSNSFFSFFLRAFRSLWAAVLHLLRSPEFTRWRKKWFLPPFGEPLRLIQ